MPFPFYPIGALVASAILAGALTLFVAAMMAINRAVSRATGAVDSGLVSGIQGWSDAPPSSGEPGGTGVARANEAAIEPAAAIPVTRVSRPGS